MTEAIATRMVKGSGRTAFIDLRRAKNDSLYVTLSVLGKNKSGEAERQLVTLFGEQAQEVAVALADILKGQDLAPKNAPTPKPQPATAK